MNPTHVFKQEEEHDGGKKKIICQGFLLPSPLPPPNLTSSHSPSASFPCTSPHHSFNPFRRFPEGTGANKGTQLTRCITWGRKTSFFCSPNISKVVVRFNGPKCSVAKTPELRHGEAPFARCFNASPMSLEFGGTLDFKPLITFQRCGIVMCPGLPWIWSVSASVGADFFRLTLDLHKAVRTPPRLTQGGRV